MIYGATNINGTGINARMGRFENLEPLKYASDGGGKLLYSFSHKCTIIYHHPIELEWIKIRNEAIDHEFEQPFISDEDMVLDSSKVLENIVEQAINGILKTERVETGKTLKEFWVIPCSKDRYEIYAIYEKQR